MAITSHNDGTYTVTWVPTSPGSYDIRVCIDGSLAGTSLEIVIKIIYDTFYDLLVHVIDF